MNKLTLKNFFVLSILLSLFCSCGETHIHEIINRTKTVEIQTEIIVKKNLKIKN